MKSKKKVKPSNNTKKLLAYTMLLKSIIDTENDMLPEHSVINQIVDNTIALAVVKHSERDFNDIRSSLIASMDDIRNSDKFVSDYVAFGLVLNSLGNIKLKGFLGLDDSNIKHTFHNDTTATDVGIFLDFDDRLNRAFNTSRYYSSLPTIKKQKKQKIKKPRDKPKKKLTTTTKKSSAKRKLVTRNLVESWCKSVGYEYGFSILKQEFEITNNSTALTAIIPYNSKMTLKHFKKVTMEALNE